MVSLLIAVRRSGFQKTGRTQYTSSFGLSCRLAAVLGWQRWRPGSGLVPGGLHSPSSSAPDLSPLLSLHKTTTTVCPSACIFLGCGSFGDSL